MSVADFEFAEVGVGGDEVLRFVCWEECVCSCGSGFGGLIWCWGCNGVVRVLEVIVDAASGVADADVGEGVVELFGGEGVREDGVVDKLWDILAKDLDKGCVVSDEAAADGVAWWLEGERVGHFRVGPCVDFSFSHRSSPYPGIRPWPVGFGGFHIQPPRP